MRSLTFRITWVLLLTLLCPSAGTEPSRRQVAPTDSRFGIDYVFPLMPRFQSDIWSRRLADTGAGWVNFAEVSWAKVEPRKPRQGVHRYQWEPLDQAVRRWQQEGFRIVFSLRLLGGWFAGPIVYRSDVVRVPEIIWKNTDRLPATEHRRDYQAWIRALVERYDGDGHGDMPGLRYGILHYQVGNEYVNPMFWTGTLEDYGTLLRETRQAARAACPQVRIISNGIRWNDLFHGDPQGLAFEERFSAFLRGLPSDAWREGWQRARTFTEATVAMAGDYDILDAGGNGPYPEASAGYLAWVRRELSRSGKSTTIWDMEARSEPRLDISPNTAFHPGLVVPGGKECLAAMARRQDPRHDGAVAWYRAEQSRLLAQVFVTRFAAGFEKVFMGMPDDWDGTLGRFATPNPYLGLLDSQGNPWPAFFAMQLLVARLDGFSRASSIASPEGVELYRFDFPHRKGPVWVAWLRENRVRGPKDPIPRATKRFGGIRGSVRLWSTPTRAVAARPVEVHGQGAGLTLELSPTPVLIESRP